MLFVLRSLPQVRIEPNEQAQTVLIERFCIRHPFLSALSADPPQGLKRHTHLLDKDNSAPVLWLRAGPSDRWTILSKADGINLNGI